MVSELHHGALMLVRRQNHILLLQRAPHVKHFPSLWTLPSGIVEIGEDPTKAAIRETKEEALIEIQEKHAQLVHIMDRTKPDGEHWLDHFFQTTIWQGQPRVGEPTKFTRLDWHPITHLPPNTIPFVRHAIDQILRGNSTSSYHNHT